MTHKPHVVTVSDLGPIGLVLLFLIFVACPLTMLVTP